MPTRFLTFVQTKVDKNAIALASSHPESVLLQCEVIKSVMELAKSVKITELIILRHTPSNTGVSRATRSAEEGKKAPEPLQKPIDLMSTNVKSPILEFVSLSVEWVSEETNRTNHVICDEETNRTNRFICDVRDTCHRSRLERLRNTMPNTVVKCFVYSKKSANIMDDISNIYKLLVVLGDTFDDSFIDSKGLTFAKIMQNNACRWHWANLNAMDDELLRH